MSSVGRSVYTASLREHRSRRAKPLSPWTASRTKRCFDVALALAALPVVAPVCLIIALAIRVSSPGPVFFLQKRMGRHGIPFSILKFRSMVQRVPQGGGSITTVDNEQITPVGRVLRAWKLDELPQLVNILRGEMSLVGPRPRVPDQPAARIECRPGITGAASLVFVREEVLLAAVPRHQLNSYYAGRVIPLKQRLDDAYMARATFASDLRLLLLTVFSIWIAPDKEHRVRGIEPHNNLGVVLRGDTGD
jgi:lipopolysaccharide/colanic/teichoic acid biosynthesis glycosyltransferase